MREVSEINVAERKMKEIAMRMRVAATLVAAVVVAASCAWAQERPLRTGVDATFAPHAMPILSGGMEGFNIDLGNGLARRLGRKLEIDATQFSGLVPGLQAGTYDFLLAPVTVNKERAESLLFTEGYLNTDFQFVVKTETPDIKAMEDLKGKTIAVNKGSTYDLWARENADKFGWTVESYGTTPDALQAVMSGRAYAILAGNTAAAWAAKNNPALKLAYLYSTGLVFAIPVRKDNVALRNELELAIECMKKDGEIAKIFEKWFGSKPLADSPVVTIYPGNGVPGMGGYDPTPHELTCR
jgi:polar amino acid transport system substrate-binding protein